MTELIDLKANNNEKLLAECSKNIKMGSIAIFPTETVYGIGANALDKKAVEQVFKIKNRKTTNPLNVLVSDEKMLHQVVKNVNKTHKLLMEKFWPGPLTILFEKSDIIPDNVTAGEKLVGVRIPSNDLTLNLIKSVNVPLIAPSANISGKLSITDAKLAYQVFNQKVDYILDGGVSDIGVESTIVKVEDDSVITFRIGKILPEEIEKLGISVKTMQNNLSGRHYDINKEAYLVNTSDNLIDEIEMYIQNNALKKIALVGCDEHENIFKNKVQYYMKYGSCYQNEIILKNLFYILNKVEKLDVDIVLIEAVKEKGLGKVIMQKLLEVCENRFI